MVSNRSRICICLRRRMYSSKAAVTASFFVPWWPIWRASSIKRSSIARLVGMGHHPFLRVAYHTLQCVAHYTQALSQPILLEVFHYSFQEMLQLLDFRPGEPGESSLMPCLQGDSRSINLSLCRSTQLNPAAEPVSGGSVVRWLRLSRSMRATSRKSRT